ncbi:DNA-directed RNA polymerase sigma-70 factor [Paenibacillus sp. 32O-W]|jgi:RNA polymerase sigma-70 factor (ECF subfamily)|uniref:RNA polymerase sigma factor n=1 Tax=Paenibacillus sp. 32O-W TaxID=1695218 RepID=UPI0007202380|nr:RNA polymerase sigma factor [Paenibacillus sp. 32O-W]ALS26810.1 DNA-directed RNA polymerase sigma-70 factor [Paenibacillus sp. 32O-W]
MLFRTGNEDEPLADSEQYEAVLKDLYNQMIRVAYARVRNKSDAQDAVQEAWVKMLAKRDTLRESNKLAPWAKAITANVSSNFNRLAVRESSCDYRGEPADIGDPAAAEAELLIEISELLGALDPRSRTLLLYKFYYGFKDQEIADALNVPVGTVKARIHRSREKLKKMMGMPNSL